MRCRTGLVTALLAASGLAGCATPGGGLGEGASGAGPGPAEDANLIVPPGHGSLRQEEITLSPRSGGVLLKVTPLEEWIIRLTAPDTWRRLHELAEASRPELRRRSGLESPSLFLVSFFSLEPAPFDPEDVTLRHRGRTLRPRAIRPLSSGWGSQRLDQRETELAVYAFEGGIDYSMDVVAQYGEARDGSWDAIYRELRAELSRARSRAGRD